MALPDQADPRWIVDDLGVTGTNVGRWHWQEQNVIEWAKKRVKELLTGVTFYESNDDKGKIECKINSVTHVKGEATVSNRKKKLIAFYQLEVSLIWQADWRQSDDSVITAKGKINLPYISDENDMDDFEIQVTLDDTNTSKQQKELKDIVYKKVAGALKPLVVRLLTELKEGANVADKYKQWEKEEKERMEKERETGKSANNIQTLPSPSLAQPISTVSAPKKNATVKITEKLRAPASLVFASFVESDRLTMVTRVPAVIEKKVGGKVMMFAGNVLGEIVELEENKKIVEKWRFKDWPADHYSTLVIEMEESRGETTVKLVQSDIPFAQAKRVEEGWQNNVFNGLKVMLGMVISSSGY